MKTSLTLTLTLPVALILGSCGSSPLSSQMTTTMVVGTAGGMVESADGALKVAIPAGALASDVMVSIEPTASPGGGDLGTVYEIGPTGTQFAMPVTLTFDYGAIALNGTPQSALRVATSPAAPGRFLPAARSTRPARRSPARPRTCRLTPS